MNLKNTIIVLLIAFFLGTAAGRWTQQQNHSHDLTQRMEIVQLKLLKDFSSELKLSKNQKDTIADILNNAYKEVNIAHNYFDTIFHQIQMSVHEEISKTLNEKQKKEFKKLQSQLMSSHLH